MNSGNSRNPSAHAQRGSNRIDQPGDDFLVPQALRRQGMHRATPVTISQRCGGLDQQGQSNDDQVVIAGARHAEPVDALVERYKPPAPVDCHGQQVGIG